MEPVFNTIFDFLLLWEMFVEKTLLKSIGKESSEFAWVLKESVEWHSASRKSGNMNEVKDIMNRRP